MTIKTRVLASIASCLVLLGSQVSFAGAYTPPTGNSPGQININNILIDSTSNAGANLSATDNSPIYGGQVFELDISQMPAASGNQDATFHSLSQKLYANSVVESITKTHDVTLLVTGVSLTNPNVFTFTVTELSSKVYGANSQLESEKIFLQGPKGETGATGPAGAIDLSSKYSRVLGESGTYYAHCPTGAHIVGGGVACPANYVLTASYPSENYDNSWYGACRKSDDANAFIAPFKVNALCIAD